MATRITIKDHIRESRIFNGRAVFALVSIILITLAIIVRMVYLQILAHEHYNTLSQNNRVNIIPLPPTRGLIYDRDGVVLAQNVPTFSLEIVPEHIKDLDQTLAELSQLVDISEQDIARFKDRLKQKRRFQAIPVRYRLNEEEVARFAVNRHRYPGIEIQARLVRDYPQTNLAVHAVGYVGRINEEELQRIDYSNYAATSHIGKLGIEKTYEELLHGAVGHQQVETNVIGRIIRVLERTPPTPGKDIFLTLNADLQRTAKAVLGDEQGAIVAVDPQNGDILALVSTADYDPNLFVNGIDQKTYEALQKDKRKPLFNRALQGQYPPGSTVKPFIGLAGLELGESTPGMPIYCRGWYTIKSDERKYRDWKKEGHGATDLKKAITESCDVYFYDLAQTLGVDRIHDYLSKFGFGQLTGIDITNEATGLLPSTQWKRRTRQQPWYLGETLIAGIGQGYTLATPLQLAVATAVLGNRGTTIQPHLLHKVRLSEMEELPFIPTKQITTIEKVEPSHWEHVIRAMSNVIYGVHGTARSLNRKRSYKIAGKTGTAQVFGIKQDEEYVAEDIAKNLRDHALFIAFAPLRDPKIAVAVIVENGGGGGSVAAPIAGKVIDYYMEGQHHE